MTAPETPAELRAYAQRMSNALALELPAAVHADVARTIDTLLAENVQLRQLADLFRFNFSPWLIHNAPDLYRSLWGDW